MMKLSAPAIAKPRRELIREVKNGQAYEYYSLGRFIVISPGVCGSRPTFKGTRVEVQTVLDCLRAGRSIDDIVLGYPAVPRPAIQEAIRLAAKALAESVRHAA
jgi:uncharacterized protein (DUF433 family)